MSAKPAALLNFPSLSLFFGSVFLELSTKRKTYQNKTRQSYLVPATGFKTRQRNAVLRFAAQGYSIIVLELPEDSEVICNTMTHQTGLRGIVPRYTTMPKRTPAHTTVGNASIIPGSDDKNAENNTYSTSASGIS